MPRAATLLIDYSAGMQIPEAPWPRWDVLHAVLLLHQTKYIFNINY